MHRSREIVMMLVKDEIVLPVVRSIYEVVDVVGPANGCVMVLPAENVAGFLSKEEIDAIAQNNKE